MRWSLRLRWPRDKSIPLNKGQMMTTSSPPSDLPYVLHRKPKEKVVAPGRIGSPMTFSIRDPQQMVWVLEGESLIAVPSDNNVKPATVFSVPCTDPDISNEKGSPIYLGVKEDLCLFCAEIEGRPTLQLKKESIMKLYEEKKAQKSFLFLRGIEGSTSTFQSVACLGWYIATSLQARQPVTLTNDRGKTYNTNFYFSSLQPELGVADSGTENL
ncbi:interleukin-36 beta-like isoform X1 [Myotis lucifugus]|uniref:interleukin-36 beta-like isoform X1 n=1 Tax=Myotis lucifugus TaxID=59463 RepID=UPI0006D73D0A|nr:interleukin-36 beta-like isoform X1 [Myotis lucifugus]